MSLYNLVYAAAYGFILLSYISLGYMDPADHHPVVYVLAAGFFVLNKHAPGFLPIPGSPGNKHENMVHLLK